MATLDLSLYQLEEGLVAFLDTEALVAPEQEQAFREELAEQVKTTVAKRDRVYAFLCQCEVTAANCGDEIKRLRARKQRFENAARRMRDYLAYILESLGRDERGKWRKLEGHTVTFGLRDNAAKPDILHPELLPAEFWDLAVTLPESAWHRLLRALEGTGLEPTLRNALAASTRTINGDRVEADLKQARGVPGALLTSRPSLVVR
jgi:hypothetical protein